MMSGMTPSRRDRFLGCLLGGAAGDALGAPVEFMKRATILERFGPRGITSYAPAYGRTGAITDDTQMTLFTAEGLLRAYVRGERRGIGHVPSVVAHAYLRWLKTQGTAPAAPDVGEDGWLFAQPELHELRAPGRTCIHSLSLITAFEDVAENGSKGCGGVMRMAPVGLFAARSGHTPAEAFQLGCELAAITHGHPTGQLTAGVLAVIVGEICGGATLPDALDTAVAQLVARPSHAETLDAIDSARRLAEAAVPRDAAVATLGEGWIAEEALAIAVYSALVAGDVEDGVVLAVNHSGDSDSTGAIAGNILGALRGVDAIPPRWLDRLELRETIARIAVDLDDIPSGGSPGTSTNRTPSSSPATRAGDGRPVASPGLPLGTARADDVDLLHVDAARHDLELLVLLAGPLVEPGRGHLGLLGLAIELQLDLGVVVLAVDLDLALLEVLEFALDLDALPAVLGQVVAFVVVEPVEDAVAQRHRRAAGLGRRQHDVAPAPHEGGRGHDAGRGGVGDAAADHDVLVVCGGGRGATESGQRHHRCRQSHSESGHLHSSRLAGLQLTGLFGTAEVDGG